MDGMKKSIKKKVAKASKQGKADAPTKKPFGTNTSFGAELPERHGAMKKKGKK
jgi:hypothetical protein